MKNVLAFVDDPINYPVVMTRSNNGKEQEEEEENELDENEAAGESDGRMVEHRERSLKQDRQESMVVVSDGQLDVKEPTDLLYAGNDSIQSYLLIQFLFNFVSKFL